MPPACGFRVRARHLNYARLHLIPLGSCPNNRSHRFDPKYLGGAIDGALVEIDAAYHQMITNMFRELAPYGQKVQRTVEEVKKIIERVYSKYPLPWE